ncbi:hypothetical protein F442_12675 [Phytophthora nicotianae P10297]|uniref:Uncharacterized protein n=2 Tax=Phytophthora nicotianae TaxID=4792 RepID=V9ES06_PHYNI|nr:hypothetical protein F443_12768 [Phytophthora nicotianae P1569]ETP39890.1 hypothetical protein F442_12675 [Phytophthora nicotianae P10297]
MEYQAIRSSSCAMPTPRLCNPLFASTSSESVFLFSRIPFGERS